MIINTFHSLPLIRNFVYSMSKTHGSNFITSIKYYYAHFIISGCPEGYIDCFPSSNNSLSFNASSSNISATCECVSNAALCNGTEECSTGFDEAECEGKISESFSIDDDN